MPASLLRTTMVLAVGIALALAPAPVTAQTESADSAVREAAAAPAPTKLRFAFWNVENLFDTDDDPDNKGDDQYLPANDWTAERYQLKLDHLAEVIAEVDPHVIGFAEIENRRVLEDLFRHEKLRDKAFGIAHRDSPDKRGIDLAVAYRQPFAVEDSAVRLHTVDIPKPTRGVLSVPLVSGGRTLHVLVNHWPSRGGGKDAVGYRHKTASVCVKEVARILAAAKDGDDPDILLLGDFNDDPYDAPVRDTLGAVRSKNAVLNRNNKTLLYNAAWTFLGRSDFGTYYYNREWVWNVFDQAIMSRGLLKEAGFQFVSESLDVFAPDKLRDQHRRPKWFRKRGKKWHEGYSDHFLIYGDLLQTK